MYDLNNRLLTYLFFHINAGMPEAVSEDEPEPELIEEREPQAEDMALGVVEEVVEKGTQFIFNYFVF
jgi:hypothetical protein